MVSRRKRDLEPLHPDRQQFRQEIRDLTEKSATGMSLKQLARLVGVSASELSRWRRGHDVPTPDQLKILCVTLRVHPAAAARLQRRLIPAQQMLNADRALRTGPDSSEISQVDTILSPDVTREGDVRHDVEQEPTASDGGRRIVASGRQKETWPPPPHQLPTTVPDFVGRGHELNMLSEQFGGVTEGGAVVIAAIGGTPGVGKTAFALRWGHSVSDQFPDGELYVNLRGYSPDRPRRSSEALTLFLVALGVPAGQVPGEEDARAALYRSLVAGKKLLVVLDNAATVEQVRPLLPGSPGCLVIVTSRSELSGLVAGHGARSIILDPLPLHESVELLRRIVGQVRVNCEPDAAAEIARRCGRLPLALRVVAQRALTHHGLRLRDIADELATMQHRRDLLATPDNDQHMDVRAVFSWSYRALDPEAARLFRLIGLHAGSEISAPATAALAGIVTTDASHLLEVLASAHLLERTEKGRYRFHDLLRYYAAEQAMTDETPCERVNAVRRVLEWYLHTSMAGYRVLMTHLRPVPLDPPDWACPTLVFKTPSQTLDWYEIERPNLVAAVHQAAERHEYSIAWKLPAALSGFYQIRKPWDDWIATCKIALSSAQRTRDKHGQCWSLSSLGIAYWGLHRYDEAQDCHQEAINICREIADLWGEGIILSFLGDVYRGRGQLENAINCYSRSRDICSTIGESWGQWGTGFALHNLGHAYRDIGWHEEAISCYEQTLDLSDKIGSDPWGKAQTLHHLGDTYRISGRPQNSIDRYQQALAIRRTIGDRHGEATALNALGIAYHIYGDPDSAGESWHQALIIYDDLGDPQVEELRARLDTLYANNTDD